jgi:streptogramin lyase
MRALLQEGKRTAGARLRRRLGPYAGRHRLSILLATLGGLVILAIGPSVGAAAPLGDVAEFSAGLNAGASPAATTAGMDGNVWFSDRGTQGAVGRATTSGVLTEFSSGINAGASLRVIGQGPDGNFWFADGGTHPGIGRITPSGAITEFDLPAGSSPDGVVAGPDGNVWFMDRGTSPAVGRITTDGTITMFGGLNPGATPHAVTVGPDGNLWFADPGKTPAIGRIAIGSTVTVTEFSTGLNPGSQPDAIVQGPDGNLWFTDIGTTKAVGRIKTDGTIAEFSLGLNPGGAPRGITPGPDGNLWFTDQGTTGAIGRITTSGAITEYSIGLNPGTVPFRIATGPDGNLWFSDSGPTKAVGRFGVGAPAALVNAVSVSGGAAEGVAQSCGGAVWSNWANTQPSSTLFPFDGYQWLRDGTPISNATAATYTPVPGDVGHDLACRLTVTYPILNVTEQTTSTTVGVRDITAPVLSLPAPLRVDATGPSGTQVSYSATATDNVDANPIVSCTPASARTFSIGTTSVRCRATDAAGNSASGSFRVTVLGAASQLSELQTAVRRVGPGASLDVKVVLARTLLAVGQRRLACLTLTAFAVEVRSQSGRTIQPSTAAALIASARRIENVLGC